MKNEVFKKKCLWCKTDFTFTKKDIKKEHFKGERIHDFRIEKRKRLVFISESRIVNIIQKIVFTNTIVKCPICENSNCLDTKIDKVLETIERPRRWC